MNFSKILFFKKFILNLMFENKIIFDLILDCEIQGKLRKNIVLNTEFFIILQIIDCFKNNKKFVI